MTMFQAKTRRRTLHVSLVFLFLCFSLYWIFPSPHEPADEPVDKPVYKFDPGRNISELQRVLVVGKTQNEQIDWILELDEHLGYPIIYSMDTPPQENYRIPHTTVGREAAAYLSYIVDFYDTLPAYSIFIHAGENQHHNDLFGPKTSNLLPHLRFESVDHFGYVNLRCDTSAGCPTDVHPLSPTQIDIDKKDIRAYFGEVYMELFQVKLQDVPEHLGNICCAQFAVSRERILQRPKSDYERMLRWADQTKLTDNSGVGWVFEKVWHVVFGMEAIHCPRFEQGRCDNYGWCGPLAYGETLTPTHINQKKVSDSPFR